MLLIYNNKVEDRALSCSTSNTPGGSNSLAMIEAKGPVLRDVEGQAIREAKGPVLRVIEGLTPNDSASSLYSYNDFHSYIQPDVLILL